MRISDWSSDVCSSDLLTALVGKMAAGNLRVLGRDAQATTRIAGRRILLRGHRQAALGDVEIEWLVELRAAVFHLYVLADNAQISRTVFDIGRYIGRANDQQRHTGRMRRHPQQTSNIASRIQADLRQKRQA